MLHKYRLNGYNIAIDVNSGAVHLLDDLAYRILDQAEDCCLPQDMDALSAALPEYSRADVEEAYKELVELQKQDMLCSSDDYEQYAKMMTLSPVKALCLNIAHDCNLRCEYCFAAKGDFGQGRCLMPFEVAKSAIDFLIRQSKGRRNLEVDFFGGEPLMNFDVVRQTVEYARSLEEQFRKRFRFTLTTNGVLLDDEIINYINKEMFNVVLSLDGRREINDQLRVTPNGKGSYDAILPKFQKLVKERGVGQYYVRGTFTKLNLDFAEDVLHMNQAGFDQMSIEPVVSDPNLPYSIQEEDLPRIFAEYERLADLVLEHKKKGEIFNFFHFKVDLDQGPCAIKRLRGCGAGNEYIAITPNGDIYPCHQFVGMEEWRMGNVLENSFDGELKKQFAASNVYAKPECKSCWAKFYCSGGCNANNQQYSGDLRTPHFLSCQLEKKRLECAIMIAADLTVTAQEE